MQRRIAVAVSGIDLRATGKEKLNHFQLART
jgi:hypothetical protein